MSETSDVILGGLQFAGAVIAALSAYWAADAAKNSRRTADNAQAAVALIVRPTPEITLRSASIMADTSSPHHRLEVLLNVHSTNVHAATAVELRVVFRDGKTLEFTMDYLAGVSPENPMPIPSADFSVMPNPNVDPGAAERHVRYVTLSYSDKLGVARWRRTWTVSEPGGTDPTSLSARLHPSPLEQIGGPVPAGPSSY